MKLTGLNRDEIRVRDMSGLSAGFLTVESGYFPSCSSSRSLSEVALGVYSQLPLLHSLPWWPFNFQA